VASLYQEPLPSKYASLTEAEMTKKILAHKKAFGDRLVLLGHHYQRDEVFGLADFTGDSLKLSQLAAKQKQAEFVVFCGVHFMAESADILTEDNVAVILPDLSAGCSMADMAELVDLEETWAQLTAATSEKIIPITYVNSLASIKAFCGQHDGACCTSSNAQRVLEYALSQGDKVLFLPDQHLGRNTAYAMGYSLDSMALYDPQTVDGGVSAEQICKAKFILWNGYCSVHQLFTETQCDEIRVNDPDCKIIVHPECPWAVVQKSDQAGSTEYILKVLSEAPEGSRWAVGTEIHLVNRAAHKYADRKFIRSLAGMNCICETMSRIDLPHLLWCLDELAVGRIVNRIEVDAETKKYARIALQRMLDHVHSQPMSAK